MRERIMYLIRCVCEIVSGRRYRRAMQWRECVRIAEAARQRRSDGAKRGWVTRRRNLLHVESKADFDNDTESAA